MAGSMTSETGYPPYPGASTYKPRTWPRPAYLPDPDPPLPASVPADHEAWCDSYGDWAGTWVCFERWTGWEVTPAWIRDKMPCEGSWRHLYRRRIRDEVTWCGVRRVHRPWLQTAASNDQCDALADNFLAAGVPLTGSLIEAFVSALELPEVPPPRDGWNPHLKWLAATFGGRRSPHPTSAGWRPGRARRRQRRRRAVTRGPVTPAVDDPARADIRGACPGRARRDRAAGRRPVARNPQLGGNRRMVDAVDGVKVNP